jgi:hypothetical protein
VKHKLKLEKLKRAYEARLRDQRIENLKATKLLVAKKKANF